MTVSVVDSFYTFVNKMEILDKYHFSLFPFVPLFFFATVWHCMLVVSFSATFSIALGKKKNLLGESLAFFYNPASYWPSRH